MKKKDIPVYKFAESEEKNPVLRKISKTMEMTEEFTVFSVLQHVARMKKAIDDKRAEADGLESALNEYLKELAIIEEQLGIKDLEAEFIKLEAEAVQAEQKPE